MLERKQDTWTKTGNLPGIDKCFKVDAISTSLGALFGMPSMTTYLESSAGVEAGGKTGLTVIFTSIFFGISLFLAPLALVIPSASNRSGTDLYWNQYVECNEKH